jgi:type I restriction enzyme, S subunit
MSRYKAYPEYRDSGLQWLGEIPAHWEVMQSRRLFAQRKEKAQPSDKQLTASQKYGVIYQKLFMELEGQSVVQVLIGSDILKHVEENDFVISMRSFQGGLEWCQYSGSVSSAYVGIIPVKYIFPGFFRYLFKSESYVQALQSTSNLVRDGQALRFENFSQVPLPRIPEHEQNAIAAFLDHETAKIDVLIEKQQRLIELLKEKRQAVISHAVTKGLNPKAPMKDSGVEWLGEVPAHWKVQRIKSVSSFTTSGPRGWSELVGDEGALFIQSGDLDDALSVGFSDAKRVQIGNNAEAQRTLLCDGDVVVCITGAKTGNVAVCSVVPENAYINQHLCLIRPMSEIEPMFLAVLLKSSFGQTYFELSQYGLKQGLSLEDVREAPVLVPPSVEQVAIATYLAAETERFDALCAKAQLSRDFLQERRTALISAAVTGKIDVRDWQPAVAQEEAGIECGANLS